MSQLTTTGLGPEIRLREATAADRPRLIEMINAAFAVETFLDGTRTDDERLAATMEKGTLLLAEDGDKRILASIFVETRGELGYIGMLAVDPAHQGKGLGRRMMGAAEDWFRKQGCKAVELTVVNLRSELPPFYQRLGYVATATREFHPDQRLRPGVACHCVVMSKRLSSQP
jgi:GNAT superfamily N-acetyltransferase